MVISYMIEGNKLMRLIFYNAQYKIINTLILYCLYIKIYIYFIREIKGYQLTCQHLRQSKIPLVCQDQPSNSRSK